MNRSRDNRSHRPRRDGFTIVELLVAMTVTLILIFALAQAFAVVGESVAKGRATIEMAGNLRMVANRLQRDLQGITVPVRPTAVDGSGLGYFEILDGLSTDRNWRVPAAMYNTDPASSDTMYGDIDDVIAFTTRNAESPFFGTVFNKVSSYGVTTLESSLAEVVWWIQFQDLNDDGVRNVGEQFLIYRRPMMIRPDLGYLPIRDLARADTTSTPPVFIYTSSGVTVTIRINSDGSITAVYPDNPPGHAQLRVDLENFFNNNDISVRLEWEDKGNVLEVKLRCNSLADLTRRENRFVHKTILTIAPSARLHPVFPYRLQTNRNIVPCLYYAPKPRLIDLNFDAVRETLNDNYGEDIMVSDALAFDVQVFDPNAPMLTSAAGDALVPSDPGYLVPNTKPTTLPTSVPRAIGFGAFVDLGYVYRRNTGADFTPPNHWPVFANRPNVKSQLNVYDYCTWSIHYERDGLDQDRDGMGTDGQWGQSGTDDNNNNIVDEMEESGWQPSDDRLDRIDEGSNAFDDNGINGVDDIGERETLPPYPVPLRGIQIQIRTWDPDSRQIRQATVVSDFVPE